MILKRNCAGWLFIYSLFSLIFFLLLSAISVETKNFFISFFLGLFGHYTIFVSSFLHKNLRFFPKFTISIKIWRRLNSFKTEFWFWNTVALPLLFRALWSCVIWNITKLLRISYKFLMGILPRQLNYYCFLLFFAVNVSYFLGRTFHSFWVW